MENSCIFVVGANLFQNKLVAFSLQQKTDLQCFAVREPAQVKKGPGTTLALYDCMGAFGNNWPLHVLDLNHRNGKVLPCLFNVDRHAGIEKKIILHGFKGFFYVDEPFSHLVKGVLAILKGDLWISRFVLSAIVQENLSTPANVRQDILTTREKEILGMLAGGATNKEIADTLCISKHTVKNHMHKIYKRINVRSKIQAALWAHENLI